MTPKVPPESFRLVVTINIEWISVLILKNKFIKCTLRSWRRNFRKNERIWFVVNLAQSLINDEALISRGEKWFQEWGGGGRDGMRGDVISGVLFCYRLFRKLKIIFLKRFSLHALQSLKNLISRHSLNVAGSILLLRPFLCQTNFRKERAGGPRFLTHFLGPRGSLWNTSVS